MAKMALISLLIMYCPSLAFSYPCNFILNNHSTKVLVVYPWTSSGQSQIPVAVQPKSSAKFNFIGAYSIFVYKSPVVNWLAQPKLCQSGGYILKSDHKIYRNSIAVVNPKRWGKTGWCKVVD